MSGHNQPTVMQLPEQREYMRSYMRERRKRNSDQYPLLLRLAALQAYGGKCSCCGEEESTFLTIDHIEGYKDGPRSGTQLYRWLRNNGYPDGFQVLCWNCNEAKGILGACPHKTGLKSVVPVQDVKLHIVNLGR